MAVFDYQGNVKKCVKGIAHRGYSASAPENTIPAYELATTNGFDYGECDISLTSDAVVMLLHDSTIDRTSDGSGTLTDMTYEEVRQYDFGSWFSDDYAGTVIPTLAEFLEYCASVSMHPYIELKSNGGYTEAQVQGVVDMVETYGLTGNVTYISFSSTYLGYIRDYDSTARLGFVVSSVSSSTITTAQNLMTGENSVFIDSSDYDSDAITLCSNADIPLEVWTLSSVSSASSIDSYISGATANGGQPDDLESYQEIFTIGGTCLSTLYNHRGQVI